MCKMSKRAKIEIEKSCMNFFSQLCLRGQHVSSIANANYLHGVIQDWKRIESKIACESNNKFILALKQVSNKCES